MHLVILTQYYPPESGAPQARLSEIAQRFVARGHQVTVLTAMPNYPTGKIYSGYGGLLRREESMGVRIIRTFIYPTQRADFLHRLTNYFSFVISSAFFGTFLLPRTDFLLVESPPLFLGLAGRWLSFVRGARMIFNVSDLWPDSVVRLGHLRAGSASHRLSVALEESCYRSAWLVSGQSAGILAEVRTRFPRKAQFHLSNGVDPAVFSPARRSPAVHAELGEGRACVAVYTGLHGLAQGLDQLIDAALLLTDVPELMIVLIGDGPEKQALEARASTLGLRNLRFRPALPRERMAAVTASSDIALAPLKITLPGAVPSKIYEGMGSGVPVLVIAGGEPAEIINRTRAGLAVPPGDPAAAAAALRRLARSPELRAELGAAGRRAAEHEYNRDVIVSRFIDHLEKEIPC